MNDWPNAKLESAEWESEVQNRIEALEKTVDEHEQLRVQGYIVADDPSQETPKGYWWCENCQDRMIDSEVMGDDDSYSHHDILVGNSPQSHQVVWREQPQPQETPKGAWWCIEDHGEEIAVEDIYPMGGGRYYHTYGGVRHEVEWREQPQPDEPEESIELHVPPEKQAEISAEFRQRAADIKKADEPEGMERYIGMPGTFGNGTPEVLGILKADMSAASNIHEKPYVNDDGTSWEKFIPHPISAEVLRLREEKNIDNEAIKLKAFQLKSAYQDRNNHAEISMKRMNEIAKLKAELEASTKTSRSLLRVKNSLERELRQYRKADTSDADDLLEALDTEEET